MINSYTKHRVWWYSSAGVVDLSEYFVSISIDEEFEPTNNSASLVLLDDDALYIGDSFVVKENDRVVVWGKEVSDNDDTSFVDTDILWDGKYVDHSKTFNGDGSSLNLKLVDWGYDVFNRFWSRNYADSGLRTDEIIVDILQNTTEELGGTGGYNVDFSNVATVRNNGSAFPVVTPRFAGKPVYEWIQELSNIDFTNTSAELAVGPVVDKPMVFRFKGNKAYWYEQSPAGALVLDESEFVDEISFSTQNEQAVNFLILECGEDFFGEPIFTYINDPLSTSTVQKDRYDTQQRISGRNNDYDNQFHLLRKDFDEASNTAFRDAVRDLAQSFASVWFLLFGRERRKFNVTIPFRNIELGDYLYISLKKFKNTYYRVTRKQVRLSTNDFLLTLECEEVLE